MHTDKLPIRIPIWVLWETWKPNSWLLVILFFLPIGLLKAYGLKAYGLKAYGLKAYGLKAYGLKAYGLYWKRIHNLVFFAFCLLFFALHSRNCFC